MSQTCDFTIVPAAPSDLRAVRMLLPETFGPGNQPEALIALDAQGGLAGAAVAGWMPVGDPPAFPVAVHVVPSARGLGLGRRLVEAIADFVRFETPALQPWGALRDDSAAAAFCLASGFEVHHRILHFLGDGPDMERMLARYRARLDESGWIPTGARVIPLRDADPAEVARIVGRQFHSNPAALLARLRGQGGQAPDPDRSVVLLLDGETVGAQLLLVPPDDLPEVEANVVVPSLRRGWANLLLTHEGTRISVMHGTRAFRFYCDERTIDTVKLARRSGAEEVATDLVLRRPVGRDGPRLT